jgi:hypothetical protein
MDHDDDNYDDDTLTSPQKFMIDDVSISFSPVFFGHH